MSIFLKSKWFLDEVKREEEEKKADDGWGCDHNKRQTMKHHRKGFNCKAFAKL